MAKKESGKEDRGDRFMWKDGDLEIVKPAPAKPKKAPAKKDK